jgi:pimeloyl-ACP methyl ester carboxylesterase
MKTPMPARVQVGRFLRMVLPAAIIILGSILGIFGILVYRITHPGAAPEAANPSHYLLPSLDVTWPSNDGSEIAGWWIPGLKGAPGVLLAPGFGMGRSDALSLALPLHEEGFNLLVYDSRGSGATPRGVSSLGLGETEDMLSALRFMKGRPEVRAKNLGIWGVDVGARAALQAAALVPEVRAVAADGAFDAVIDFVDVRIREDLGFENRLLEFGCRQMFKIIQIGSVSLLSEALAVGPLSDRGILFIRGENRKDLGRLTEAVYDRIQPQKEMVTLKLARIHLMSGEDLKNYDRQVVTFFHLNLKG